MCGCLLSLLDTPSEVCRVQQGLNGYKPCQPGSASYDTAAD